jgi:hypothetical protein
MSIWLPNGVGFTVRLRSKSLRSKQERTRIDIFYT